MMSLKCTKKEVKMNPIEQYYQDSRLLPSYKLQLFGNRLLQKTKSKKFIKR